MEIFRRLFSLPKKDTNLIAEHFLPDNVRYALKYRQALFRKEEILSLMHSAFYRLGISMALKALPYDERKLLLLDAVLNENLQNVQTLATKYIPKSAEIKGMKAGQYSRQMEAIHNMFHIKVNSVASIPYIEPLLMAHTTLIGLDWFKAKFNNFGIVLPTESMEGGVPIGYYITRESLKGRFLIDTNLVNIMQNSSSDFVGIDDTYKKGYQGRQIQSMFNQNGLPLQGYEYLVFSGESSEP
jgi:hypothetical protein